MLIIIGFCIFAIPDGETRRVDRFPVFGITAVASVFAYIWLLFILKINTEGIVELWEAIVTFLWMDHIFITLIPSHLYTVIHYDSPSPAQ